MRDMGKKTLNRVLRLAAPIANCPDYDSDDFDTSTLEGEDTFDEVITVLPKRRRKDRIFTLEGKKRNGGDENEETFSN